MSRVADVITRDTGKDISDTLNYVAAEVGVDPVELVGGAIAESNLDEHSRRERAWADVSYGLFHPSVAWCSRPDGLIPSADPRYRNADAPVNRDRCKQYFWDAERAIRYVGPQYAALRYKYGNALDAWCRYNKPNLTPADNVNRANYARGLSQAEQYRIEEEPLADITLPSKGPDPVFASLEEAAAYCGAEAYRKQLIETGAWAIAVRDEALFKQCYETLNPMYVEHFDELRLGK